MLTPGLIFNRQLAAFYKTLHCCKLLLTSSTTISRQYCYFTDRSVNEETFETMASKNNKKQKLSDSESASSASSGSGSDSENSTPPPRKEAKTKSKPGNDSKTSKTSSSAESSKGKGDSLRVVGETEPTWDLGGSKFVTVRDFKGKTYVNIREYYMKDGKSLPGKKGISLNPEQWKSICSTIDEVNQVLKK